MKPKLHIAGEAEILRGDVTDVYFRRACDTLRKEGVRSRVAMEVRLKKFPNGYPWGVFAGLEEATALLAGKPVDLWALPEGTIFRAEEPVLYVEGEYTSFGEYETSLLGLLCQASGVATKAARLRKIVGKKTLVSFGARRMHPAVSPMIERAAFLGGCDGVASVAAARLLGEDPLGTVPHALILLFGDTVKALQAWDRRQPRHLPRVALVDTLADEKMEALRAAQALGKKLAAVRLDTPGSRRGDFAEILREVRWELDLAGHRHVRIFVSGGLDEENIPPLLPYADGFGVGTALSNAPVLDFAADIVEINGRPAAKRGKLSGRKMLWVSRRDPLRRMVLPAGRRPGPGYSAALVSYLRRGRPVGELPPPRRIRSFVLSRLSRWSL